MGTGGAAASSVLPACGEGTRVERTATAPRGQAGTGGQDPGARRGRRLLDWDNRHELTLAGDGFQVTRTHPAHAEVEITMRVPAKRRWRSGSAASDGFSITRGRVVRGVRIRTRFARWSVESGVAAFREQVGHYERRLIAGAKSAGSMTRMPTGSCWRGRCSVRWPATPSRSGGRAISSPPCPRAVPRAGVEFRDCVRDYELYLMSRPRAHRLPRCRQRPRQLVHAWRRPSGCEVEFIAGAMAGEGQFISCTALGSILQ